jgi:hypothetical protein
VQAASSLSRAVQNIVEEIRPRLSAAGVSVEPGRTVSPAECSALEARTGIRFPPSFRAFLETVGGLRLITDNGEELRFLGPGELVDGQAELAAELVIWRGDTSAADDALLAEFETWGGLPLRAVPILRSPGPLSSCKILNFAGQVCEFYRGALELCPESFSELLAVTLADFVAAREPGGLLDQARIAREQMTAAFASVASLAEVPDEEFETKKARLRALEAKALRGMRSPTKRKGKAKGKGKAKAKPAKANTKQTKSRKRSKTR